MSKLSSKGKIGRNFCFTWNNYDEEDVEDVKNWDKVKYCIIGYEKGKKGTPHLQGYVEFENDKTMTALKKLSKEIHWEARKGTAKQAREYCTKEKYEEWGQINHQGERCDLIEIKDRIMNGEVTPDELCLEDPELYHQYGRTLNKIYDIYLSKQKRKKEMPTVIWYYGKTGVGKSHTAYEQAGDDYYEWPDDGEWWDEYKGQETVVMNEFRGQIMFGRLLRMFDKWECSVRRRNRSPMPLMAKKFIITSSKHPRKIYYNIEEDIEQLYRRCEIIKLKNGAEVLGGNTIPRAQRKFRKIVIKDHPL